MLYEPIMYYARNIDREIKEDYEEIEYYIVLTYLVEDILDIQRKIHERVREKRENKKT